MSEPSLIARQRTLLHDLAGIAADRARAEPALARTYLAETQRADKELEDGRATLRRRHAQDRETLDREFRQSTESIEAHFTTEQQEAQKEYTKARWELTSRIEAEKAATESAFQQAQWAAEAIFEGAKTDAATRLREDNARLVARMEQLQGYRQEARAQLAEWNESPEEFEEAARNEEQPDRPRPKKMTECLEKAKEYLEELQDLIMPQYKGRWLFGITLLPWMALIFPFGWLILRYLEKPFDLPLLVGLGAAVSTVVSTIGGLIAQVILRTIACKQIRQVYIPFCRVLNDAEVIREHLLKRYQTEHDQAVAEAEQRYHREVALAQSRQDQKLTDITRSGTGGLGSMDSRYQAQRDLSERRRSEALLAAEQRHQQGLVQVDQQFEKALSQLEDRLRVRKEEIHTRHFQEWKSLVARWQRGLLVTRQSVAQINHESDELFPGWNNPFWNDWRPSSAPPPVIRFGSYAVQTQSVVETPPWEEPRPQPTPINLTLPGMYGFPEPASLLIHSKDEGLSLSAEVLRTVMFRLLTSLPPGRVRFVIVDPVGLGQNFAAFMNLADYDEALVGSRIWTEAAHIEQRLADLTAHMENVIQKYLRNRYPTISDYNAHAGEVAEPFRVLVVANFPTNFTAEAVRRLVSIAQSGPRCGVSTLISVDTKQPLPKGFDLADLERCGVNLLWDKGQFRWRDEDFGRYPLTLDRLPDEDFCNRILRLVGEKALGAQRVEVPFEFIAPAREQWWTGSTRSGISVPLGRSGATRRQHLELGKGTSQHALVAGKTGSGKSTLLHALITNLALLYSPDEVELYLVDFKKGVEFKTYAVHELPHARVVAIESEREFGLSVLQRLDAELAARGERFRAVSAQDLNAYRQSVPRERSPRILLIVDEFQEFFVEDDRIAQEAARLLDRLVRQGRAFGMHVLLGSQTLGGAYSLARSTIDQMAVRIALQCSEADAHLILSDDNSAARLLSRPGEAIYNDANGLVEGNDPFQVVWLGEEQREQYLTRVRDLTQKRPPLPRPATVIFEGNASADVSKNHLLNRLFTQGSGLRAQGSGEQAWLGEAMAIDELTAAGFRRQNGSNLVIVGQQPEAALGMMVTGVISLAAHALVNGESETTRIYIVDGQQADAPRTGLLAQLRDLLPVRITGWRELPAILTELSAELERRQSSPNADVPSIYLVLYAVQRMRDLRRQEDDFGFMSRGEEQPATPDKQLATLLREGSALGIHTLMWCDTLSNLQRALDRQTMRELAMRVVFQMSVADSSNLIDTPAASKLGLHRALFCNEEDGRLEKFRPYSVLPEEWLAWVGEQFRRREVAGAAASSGGG